jgi:primosomal protein N'
MHVECWGSGVDFLVVTPFYIVSNLYKRKVRILLSRFAPNILEQGLLHDLIRFISKYYLRGLGEVALPALPIALRNGRGLLFDEACGTVSLRTGQAAWKKWQKIK